MFRHLMTCLWIGLVGLLAVGGIGCGAFEKDTNHDKQKAAAEPVNLSDSQVLANLRALNDGEVITSQAALANLTNSKVRDFAKMMIDAHNKANDDLRDLGDRLHLQPEADVTSRQIGSKTDMVLADLREKRGGDLDWTYMNAQVQMHQDALDRIDQSLLHTARNSELRSMIQKIRSTVADHLRRAEDLRGTLNKA